MGATLESILLGAAGGAFGQFAPNVLYAASWSRSAKKGFPDRFKIVSTYLAVAFGAVTGVVATFLQGSALDDRPQLALQIGLMAPLLVASVWRALPDADPGTVNPSPER